MSNNSSFETGVDALENSFRGIKNDLSATAHRLDNSFDEASHQGGGGPHPMKLLHRIQVLEKTLSLLHDEWDDVVRTRENLVPQLTRVLRENTRRIHDLSQQSGCSDVEYEQVSSTLLRHLGNFDIQEKINECSVPPFPPPPPIAPHIIEEKTENLQDKDRKPSDLDYLQFDALPVSVRGRVKFETIQSTYELIEQLFIQKNCRLMKGLTPDPVLLKDLHEQGGLVLGRSGEHLLSSLRALKLVTVTKHGVSLVRKLTNKEKAVAKAELAQNSRSQY